MSKVLIAICIFYGFVVVKVITTSIKAKRNGESFPSDRTRNVITIAGFITAVGCFIYGCFLIINSLVHASL